MKIGIIIGSHRAKSQSTKVGRYMQHALENDIQVDTYVLDLRKNPLPLWDESVWKGDGAWKKKLDPIKKQVSACDGFVVISPEWSGMVTPGLKNFLLLMSKKELGHKPALITTVSASRGGAYPVSELRMSSYKNTRILYIPEHIIVRNVADVLNDTNPDSENRADTYIRDRISFALTQLVEYTTLLLPLQKSSVINHPDYANGMS